MPLSCPERIFRALFGLVFALATVHGQILITEFLAENKSGLKDEDGDRPDWIEILNSGPARVDLANWALTDDSKDLLKWRFPAFALLPGDRQIIFASGKNRAASTNWLHTNFKLSKGGGYLALVDAATNVVSEFPNYPAQFEDTSFGRDPWEPKLTGFLGKPTPGKPNVAGGLGSPGPVQFSREEGFFTDPLSLQLSVKETNAIIHFTLSSAHPTETSSVYTAAIPIGATSVVVRARAFLPGALPGPVTTANFMLMNTNLLGFSSDLPVLVIHPMGSKAFNPTNHEYASLSWFEPRTGRTSLTNRPALTTKAGVRTRGSSTAEFPKSSFAIQFWDEQFEEADQSPLGLPPDSDWVLYAPNIYETVMIHNPFVHTLVRNMGVYSPRTRFVEVFRPTGSAAVASNSYFGVYVLEEKIKISKDRVDIDKVPLYAKGDEVTGGYLMKIDRLAPGENALDAGGNALGLVNPSEPDLKVPQRAPQLDYVQKHFDAFGAALKSPAWQDPVLGYAPFIDVDNWVEYHNVETLAGNGDALSLSAYFRKPRNGKIMYGPHWDFDRGLGATDIANNGPRIWTTGQLFASPWWNRILADRDFWQKWVDHWEVLRTNYFSNAYLYALTDALAAELREAQVREAVKWRPPYRGGYQGEVNLMKAWISNRTDFVDRQLTPMPVLSSPGGRVPPGFTLSISAVAAATVFYTTNGADPRGAQGVLGSDAIEYTGPISIQGNTRVIARARNLNQKQAGGPLASTPWSGPRQAIFITDPLPLSISEIMFHPPLLGGSPAEAELCEFVEIQNRGSKPIALKGVGLRGGISLETFPANSEIAPGGFVLVVKNLAAFQKRYGTVTNVAGEYSGSLQNQGDRIVLTGPTGEIIQDISYKPGRFPAADGLGFSLVAAPEAIAPGASPWRVGRVFKGTPGQAELPPQAAPAIVISQVFPSQSDSEAIALSNSESAPVDISGWLLSDDVVQPNKFAFPAGTILQPNQPRVFTKAALGAVLPLNPKGGELFLIAALNGTPTSCVHRFTYGAVGAGQAYGRFLTAAGLELFRPASRLPQTGLFQPAPSSLRITEIMYHPAPFRTNVEAFIHEFVEIQNTTDQPVSLSANNRPWRVRGGIDFDFPTNAVVPPSGFALLVSFDPEKDPGERNAFFAQYGMTQAPALFGPYSGQLNNGSESLKLQMPSGAADYVDSDAVGYSPEMPWPAYADGTGLSIQRISSDGFGDDPLNWISAKPTPAALSGSGDADQDGLPDWWEIAHHLDPANPSGNDGPSGDPDGDHMTNMEEFLAGTDPSAADSYLKVTQFSVTQGPTLRFWALAGRPVTLLYSDDLRLGVWNKLASIPAPATSQELSISDPADANPSKRFYRLSSP